MSTVRLPRVRTSDAVVDHIIGELFAGRLRAGDRIDLDALAEALGVSRVPVREALAQLERDGIVGLPHHRGAYIAAFDASTVREAFELYALLSGLTSSRVARQRDEDVIATLTDLQRRIARTRDIDRFEALAREVRHVVNLAAAGPHLRALLRTFRGLVPAAARLGMKEAMPREREYLDAELDAIRRGAAATAAGTAIKHIRYSGECAVRGLVRRGIVTDTADDVPGAGVPDRSADLLRVLRSVQAG